MAPPRADCELPPAGPLFVTSAVGWILIFRVPACRKRAGRGAANQYRRPGAKRPFPAAPSLYQQTFFAATPVELVVIHAHAVALQQEADPAPVEHANEKGTPKPLWLGPSRSRSPEPTMQPDHFIVAGPGRLGQQVVDRAARGLAAVGLFQVLLRIRRGAADLPRQKERKE